jgi:hypothetical protein
MMRISWVVQDENRAPVVAKPSAARVDASPQFWYFAV